MKKILAMLLALCMVFALCACGGNNTTTNAGTDTGSSNAGGNTADTNDNAGTEDTGI